ncbi:hypothetical protein LGH70_22435 [Hymenobacter sp. BT635]|uniref:Uncharacterized protein n=1 Tax=Hymenobacter nitidus TaxID=2880929 RepID=A0ABS8AL26_9BACT|nr:hypothetical protein [Hymenobacter nitidus]MCB2380367.1 hypothetical protein [Hymenobacter nitidus]
MARLTAEQQHEVQDLLKKLPLLELINQHLQDQHQGGKYEVVAIQVQPKAAVATIAAEEVGLIAPAVKSLVADATRSCRCPHGSTGVSVVSRNGSIRCRCTHS